MSYKDLHPEIRLEAGAILEVYEASGWKVSAFMYEASFTGDWFVDLSRGKKCIRLMKESELFTLRTLDDTEAESEDLGRSYDNFPAFREAATQWARSSKSSSRESV